MEKVTEPVPKFMEDFRPAPDSVLMDTCVGVTAVQDDVSHSPFFIHFIDENVCFGLLNIGKHGSSSFVDASESTLWLFRLNLNSR